MPEPILGPVPFRLRSALAAPAGWPPDVLPNQLIASAHINLIRDSVFAWPGDVDGQNHKLKNVILENVVGVVTDPTTTKGDLIARGASALVRLGAGADGQVLIADAASAAGLKWIPFPAVGVSSVFGRAGIVTAQAGDYNVSQVTNALSSTGSYSDPPWLTAFAWAKLVGVPATFAPAAHTHAATDIVSGIFSPARMGSGVADATVFLRGDGTWSVPGGPGGVVPTSRLVSGGYGLTPGGSLAADVTLAVVDNTNIQKVRVLRTPFGGAAAVIGARWSLNLIEGSNVTISAVDDAGNDRVNVTIASAGGGGTGGAVDSVFGRTGAVLAQSGDYNVSQITGALSDPTTSKGDLLARTVSALARVPVGIDGQVLTADNAQPTGVKWAAAAGGGAVASVFGRTGIVTAQPGDYTAAQVTGAVVNPTSAKGDLMVRDSSAVQRLPLGSNGFVLMADSAQTLGVKWAAVAAGSAQTPWTQDINAAGFRLINTGNVGIGTASPQYTLDVAGDVGIGPSPRTAVISVPTDGASDSGAFVVSTRSLGTLAERMRVSAAGGVGIGTASPTGRLTIVPNGTWVPNASAGMANIALVTSGAFGGGIGMIDGSTMIGMSMFAGEWIFGNGATSGVLTERMRITAEGMLDVSGTVRATGLSSPVAGAGVEVKYTASIGYVEAFDRSAAVYRQLRLGGSLLQLNQGSPVSTISGFVIIRTPSNIPDGTAVQAQMPNNSLVFFLDEGAGKLMVYCKRTDGAIKVGSITIA